MPVAGSAVLIENGAATPSPSNRPSGCGRIASPRAIGDLGGVIRLEPLARQDLATVDELGRGEPHDHAVGRPRAVRPRPCPRCPRRRRRRRRCRRQHRSPRHRRRGCGIRTTGAIRGVGELRRDRRIRLGEGIGQIAEDVGRVVELDELIGACEAPPLPLGLLGNDLGPEFAGRTEYEALVVVVDDHHLPEKVRCRCGRLLEVVEQSRLRALTAFLVLERKVVEASRCRLVIGELDLGGLAGSPRVGRTA